MEERLLLIWVNVRNIVNILFVFILLAIAFYNVVGAGDNYHIKRTPEIHYRPYCR